MIRNKLNLMIYYLLQLSWGLLQNILGLFLFLYIYFIKKKKCYWFYGAIVIEWDKLYECMGLGMFIFMCSHHNQLDRQILVHEYGHTIQSIILGPFYLLVIGLPSLIWNTSEKLKDFRNRNHLSYYWLYCEKWANNLGEKCTGFSAPESKRIS